MKTPMFRVQTFSPPVTVTVAEIAGIIVEDGGVVDVNSGEVLPGDVINFDFIITNTGNDTTRITIPTPVITGPGTFTAGSATVIAVNGTALGVPVSIPTGGAETRNTAATNDLDLGDITITGLTGSEALAPDQTITVRVPVTVNALAASGATIAVRLGDTVGNDNVEATTQNQESSIADGANDNEVRTIDNNDGQTDEAAGTPANGEREASRFQDILVGATAQAFPTLLKTNAGIVDNGATPLTPTPNNLTDDYITYNLGLEILGAAPANTSGVTAGDIGPYYDRTTDAVPAVGATGISVNGSSVNVILISDAIPANTKLNQASGTPLAPTNWVAVYTTDSLTTTNANDATWLTFAATPLANQAAANAVTRVGFIYVGADNTANTNADNSISIASGTVNITGFSFTVRTSGVTVDPTTIANIAQVFGTTDGDQNDDPANDNEVYDESGDDDPANFNDDGTPNTNDTDGTAQREDIDNGVANPSANGIDNDNDNTGSGADGEDNVVTLATPGSILNDPEGQPAAVGVNDNTDDFTNQSTPVPASTAPGTTINPEPITFTNTINNPGSTNLTNILLVPDTFEPTATDAGLDGFFDTIAAAALTVPGNPGNGGGTTLVPYGTTVSISFNGDTALYTYTDLATDNFVYTSGTAIRIPTLPAGGSVDYTVTVNLPANTPLSTDSSLHGGSVTDRGIGFDVPIYAFVDTNGNSRPDQTDVNAGTGYNRTIDRVYTGYLRLVKEQRLLEADGTTQVIGFTTGTLTPTDLQPGRIIEYRITYANVSVAPAGSDNVTLNANPIDIRENGSLNTANTAAATPTGNNWAQGPSVTGAPGNTTTNLFTSHVIGGASATFGNITYDGGLTEQSGTTQATDVIEYINAITVDIIPGQSGVFTFQRQLN